MLPEDGNVMPKHVGATIHIESTESIIGVFVGFSGIFLLGIIIFKGSLLDVFVSRLALKGYPSRDYNLRHLKIDRLFKNSTDRHID
jgi:hypothetical protein